MTVVIKFAVVGQGIFYDKIIGQGAVSQQLAVLRGKGCVVFAGASVFIAFAVIDGDIAEDYAQLAAVFRSGDDRSSMPQTVPPALTAHSVHNGMCHNVRSKPLYRTIQLWIS